MKRFAAFFALASFTAVLLSGCGGSDNPVTDVPSRYIPITLNLTWSAINNSRAVKVPVEARSAVIRLTNLTVDRPTENDLVTVAVINRRANAQGVFTKNAYNQTFTTSGVVARPNVRTFSEVQFWSETGGKGTLISTVKKSSVLSGNGDLGNFNQATGNTD